jgi:hypothetical protein
LTDRTPKDDVPDATGSPADTGAAPGPTAHLGAQTPPATTWRPDVTEADAARTTGPLIEDDPYPAAARPSFDIPVSAPVSARAPDVLQRIAAPTTGQHEAGSREDSSPAGRHSGRSASHSGADGRSTTAGPSTSSRPSSRGRRAAVVALSLLLVLALGAGAYLAVLSHRWEERSGEWEAQSRDLGSEVADLTGDVAGMTSELTIVRDQLATAQTRITELADEKAQVGDDRESQKILADDVQEVAETALDVSAALGDCVTAQSTVMGYLAAPETTTPEVIATAATQADTVCAAAVEDYNSLQQDLADS